MRPFVLGVADGCLDYSRSISQRQFLELYDELVPIV